MKKFRQGKKIIPLLIFLVIFPIGSIALAAEIEWPRSPAGTQINIDNRGRIITEFHEFIKYLYEWGIALGGLAAFIALIIAGFQYLISVGNPAVMNEAMDRIKSAILGLVLLLSSWLILNTINPQLTTFVRLSFNPQDIATTTEAIATTTEVRACTRIEIYGEPGAERTVKTLEPNKCLNVEGRLWWREDIVVPGGSSQGFVDDRKDRKCYYNGQELERCPAKIEEGKTCECIFCEGSLQLFNQRDCIDKIAGLPVTNRLFSVDRNINSVRLFIENVE